MTERNPNQEVYNRIFTEGLLGKRQFEAYHVVFYCGPISPSEIDRLAAQQFEIDPGVLSPWSRRLQELEKRGVISRVSAAASNHQGSTEFWDVTGNLPLEKVKASQIPKPDEFEEAVDFVRDAVRFFSLESNTVPPKNVDKLLKWLSDKSSKRTIDAAKKESSKSAASS